MDFETFEIHVRCTWYHDENVRVCIIRPWIDMPLFPDLTRATSAAEFLSGQPVVRVLCLIVLSYPLTFNRNQPVLFSDPGSVWPSVEFGRLDRLAGDFVSWPVLLLATCASRTTSTSLSTHFLISAYLQYLFKLMSMTVVCGLRGQVATRLTWSPCIPHSASCPR